MWSLGLSGGVECWTGDPGSSKAQGGGQKRSEIRVDGITWPPAFKHCNYKTSKVIHEVLDFVMYRHRSTWFQWKHHKHPQTNDINFALPKHLVFFFAGWGGGGMISTGIPRVISSKKVTHRSEDSESGSSVEANSWLGSWFCWEGIRDVENCNIWWYNML